MATSGQVEFIDDLMERHGLTVDDLPEEFSQYMEIGVGGLSVPLASELIEWLQDYGKA